MNKRVKEVDNAIVRLRAVISHRVAIVNQFEQRDAIFTSEIAVIQARRDQLKKDYDSAAETIADAKKRIHLAEIHKSSMTMRSGTGSGKPKLSDREKKLRRLKKALAAVESLTQELGENA